MQRDTEAGDSKQFTSAVGGPAISLEEVVHMIRCGDPARLKDGEALLREMLEQEPPPSLQQRAEILHYLGLAAMQASGGTRDQEAADFFHRAIEIDPTSPEYYGNLGSALGRQGRPADALLVLDKAIELKADYAHVHSNRAVALQKLERWEEATIAFERALELDPCEMTARHGLASVLTVRGFHEEAVEHFQKLLDGAPGGATAEVYAGLADTLRKLGRLDEALAAYRKGVMAAPHSAEAHNNLGICLLECGDEGGASTEAALVAMQKAIALRPAFADAHWNLSLALLTLGDHREHGGWERGWLEYEWRQHLKSDIGHRRGFPQPAWNGGAIAGRTILLTCEQGLGDVIQFVRYVTLVAVRGAKVVFESPPPLLALMKGAEGIDTLVARGEPLPPFDVHARLMSLPGIFRTTPKNVPAAIPYLRAEPARVEKWRRELEAIEAAEFGGESLPPQVGTIQRPFRIGIAWQGSKTFGNDANRSIPLAHFAPLARVRGVRLYSLQKGTGSEQAGRLKESFPIAVFGPPSTLGSLDEDGSGAFVDTAAVITHLDLVITSDTAIAHLAGALGARVWVALGAACDWRWMLGREDSPWYPTMRLFRQYKRGDWAGVFEHMAAALRAECNVELIMPAKPVTIPISHGELFDRLGILQIKSERLPEGELRLKVREELAALQAARDAAIAMTDAIAKLARELRSVNEALWQIEDDLRLLDAAGEFGQRYVDLARSVYQTNRRRSALKQQINQLLGSPLIEAKLYAGETPTG